MQDWNTGLTLDILKMVSWAHMGRTVNIIIKGTIHIFASIGKIMRILLMGRRNRERWNISIANALEILKSCFKQLIYSQYIAVTYSTILYNTEGGKL